MIFDIDPVQSFELQSPLTLILPLDIVVLTGLSMTRECLHFMQYPVTASVMDASWNSFISTRLSKVKL